MALYKFTGIEKVCQIHCAIHFLNNVFLDFRGLLSIMLYWMDKSIEGEMQTYNGLFSATLINLLTRGATQEDALNQ